MQPYSTRTYVTVKKSKGQVSLKMPPMQLLSYKLHTVQYIYIRRRTQCINFNLVRSSDVISQNMKQQEDNKNLGLNWVPKLALNTSIVDNRN